MWLAALAALMGITDVPARPDALQQRVLDELNRVRAAPQAYVPELRTFRSWHQGALLRIPGRPFPLRTREGAAAVAEAAAFAEHQQAVPPLTYSPLLAQAAADHAAYLADGYVGHDWEDGTGPSDRVKRRGGGAAVAEIISFGFDDAAAVVRQFIVDDGVPSRGHRFILFHPSYHYAGVACGPHRRYGATCVVTLAATPDGR